MGRVLLHLRPRSVLALGVELGGASAIAYGAWLAWEPAGFLVGGILSMAIIAPGIEGGQG